MRGRGNQLQPQLRRQRRGRHDRRADLVEQGSRRLQATRREVLPGQAAVFAQAKTSDVGELPARLLPRVVWEDDLELAADLRRQLDSGVETAKTSPFRTAVDVTDFDAASKSFGFAATARLYQRVTGDTRYAAFGARQRDFTLGANAWDVSLVVGVGSTFPHYQAANLAGPSKVLYGAVVNGPNGADNFADLPFPAGAKECTRPYESFDGQGSRYADDLSSWPSNEPAIDFTSTALLAFSL